jgi:starch phosphorylase
METFSRRRPRDGATIEMAEEAGEDSSFLFGLIAEQVANSRGWYDPHWHYEHEPERKSRCSLTRLGRPRP